MQPKRPVFTEISLGKASASHHTWLVTQALSDLIQDVRIDWKSQAACRGYPDELFFPVGDTDEEQIATALAVCDSCKVREECLSYALESNQRAGIWGGTTEKERRSLRRRWLAERKRSA